jgi:hypothetical protein
MGGYVQGGAGWLSKTGMGGEERDGSHVKRLVSNWRDGWLSKGMYVYLTRGMGAQVKAGMGGKV